MVGSCHMACADTGLPGHRRGRIACPRPAWVSRDLQQGVFSFGQNPVATAITRATFFGLMVFPVHLDDQLQRNTAEVGRVGRNRILTRKLLLSTPSIAHHLPHGVRKLVPSAALVSRKRDGLRVAARSSSWAGALVHEAT
jgi:hypothetical protein